MITLTMKIIDAAGEIKAERSGDSRVELCYLEEYLLCLFQLPLVFP